MFIFQTCGSPIAPHSRNVLVPVLSLDDKKTKLQADCFCMFCWKIVVGIVGGRPDPQWVGESAAGRAAHETISNLKAANSC